MILITGTRSFTGISISTEYFRRKVREEDRIMCEWGYTIVSADGTRTEHIKRRVVHNNDTYRLQQQLRAELHEQAMEEYRIAEEARIRQDDELQNRANQLLALDKGGCIATIAREYPNYTSVWEYRVTKDNTLIRTRPGDRATVIFDNTSELLDDYNRYRWAQFEIV